MSNFHRVTLLVPYDLLQGSLNGFQTHYGTLGAILAFPSATCSTGILSSGSASTSSSTREDKSVANEEEWPEGNVGGGDENMEAAE